MQLISQRPHAFVSTSPLSYGTESALLHWRPFRPTRRPAELVHQRRYYREVQQIAQHGRLSHRLYRDGNKRPEQVQEAKYLWYRAGEGTGKTTTVLNICIPIESKAVSCRLLEPNRVTSRHTGQRTERIYSCHLHSPRTRTIWNVSRQFSSIRRFPHHLLEAPPTKCYLGYDMVEQGSKVQQNPRKPFATPGNSDCNTKRALHHIFMLGGTGIRPRAHFLTRLADRPLCATRTSCCTPCQNTYLPSTATQHIQQTRRPCSVKSALPSSSSAMLNIHRRRHYATDWQSHARSP